MKYNNGYIFSNRKCIDPKTGKESNQTRMARDKGLSPDSSSYNISLLYPTNACFSVLLRFVWAMQIFISLRYFLQIGTKLVHDWYKDQNLIFSNNGFAFTNICKTLSTYTVLILSSIKKYIL